MAIETKFYQLNNILIKLEENLNKIKNIVIKLKLKDIINNLKKSDTWKIQLTIVNNFIFFADNDEEHVRHSKTEKHRNHD